ncbi:unnamed protein product [Timema podura]|uniref:Rubicon Homology domain-containing protein n=1 Tax=Timema podura TaxID=61482 RepID=A0ABN7NXT1_TIMPD|nr:unnamed protein product [Timema podura]
MRRRHPSTFQALRHQLNLLRAYLFTCREPVIEDLQKRVWPREYLYEHVHLYSVAVTPTLEPSFAELDPTRFPGLTHPDFHAYTGHMKIASLTQDLV